MGAAPPHPFLRGGGVPPLLPKKPSFPKNHNFSEEPQLFPKNRAHAPNMTAHDARDEGENRRDKGRNRRDGGRNRRDKGRNRRDGTVNNGHETIRVQCNVTVGPRARHAERDGYYVPRAEADRGATRLAAPTRARRRAG